MAIYYITGTWRNIFGIAEYAIHLPSPTPGVLLPSTRYNKSNAIALVENKENTVKTAIWNYNDAQWKNGEDVHIAGTGSGRYLRSDRDKSLTDNLAHLIDYSQI